MRLSGTKTGAVNQYRGLGNQLWDLAGNRPSLDLPFSDTKSLVDTTTGKTLVDFTRASSGTYVGSDGLIKTATTNLLLQSEDFSTTWSPIRSSVSVNSVIAPNGTTTADTLIEDTSATATHFLSQGVSITSGTSYTFSVFVKRALGTRNVNLRWSGGVAVGNMTLNLDTGDITASSAIEDSSAIPFPSGWWRVSFRQTATSTGTFGLQIFLVGESGISYTGDGTSGIYLWGAQLEQSSTVGEYVKTTSTINSAPRFDHDPTTGESLGLLVEESRTNLLPDSEDFSSRSLAGTSLTANATTAPDGNVTATLIIEDTSTSQKRWYHTVNTGSAFTTFTWSIYVKANSRKGITLYPKIGTGGCSANFNLEALTTSVALPGSAATEGSATIEDAGNNWHRLSVTTTFAVAQSSITLNGYFSNDNNDGDASYTGDGVSGIYIWGAQLEAGSFPTSYIPTEGSAVTRAADLASISGSNFSSWYRQDEGTVFSAVQQQHQNTVGGALYWVFSDTTSNNLHRAFGRAPGTLGTETTVSGVTQAGRTPPTGPITAGLKVNLSYGYKANEFRAAANGVTDGADTSGSLPTITTLEIGGSQYMFDKLNGTVSRLTYWPTRLPNETLQTITQ